MCHLKQERFCCWKMLGNGNYFVQGLPLSSASPPKIFKQSRIAARGRLFCPSPGAWKLRRCFKVQFWFPFNKVSNLCLAQVSYHRRAKFVSFPDEHMPQCLNYRHAGMWPIYTFSRFLAVRWNIFLNRSGQSGQPLRRPALFFQEIAAASWRIFVFILKILTLVWVKWWKGHSCFDQQQMHTLRPMAIITKRVQKLNAVVVLAVGLSCQDLSTCVELNMLYMHFHTCSAVSSSVATVLQWAGRIAFDKPRFLCKNVVDYTWFLWYLFAISEIQLSVLWIVQKYNGTRNKWIPMRWKRV